MRAIVRLSIAMMAIRIRQERRRFLPCAIEAHLYLLR